MLFPRCGKVLVIDDQIEEAMPLLNLLGKKGVPTMYYSGKFSDLPETPFDEVRLVFCDLKFNAASDQKSVASNVASILTALVSAENGPFILLVWSAHGTDYIDALKEILDTTSIKPEFVMQLDKASFFESKDSGEDFDSLIESVSGLGLDVEDEKNVKNLIDERTLPLRTVTYIARPDALDGIEVKLAEELKKASLFHLFVLWENTISSSAVQTVNNNYQAIPETIPVEKKLEAMLYYLAVHRLEQQMSDSDEETKFISAMDSLNEMFSYFYTENVHKMSVKQVEVGQIEKIEGLRELAPSKFNQWRMIGQAKKGYHPGNVYKDTEKLFQYHGFIGPNAFSDKENYERIILEIAQNPQIEYVFVDLSSECDIAQNKLFLSRIVPGVMIPFSDFEQYQKEKKIKKGSVPEYIFLMSDVEIKGKTWAVMFNVNQMAAAPPDKLMDENLLFSLTGSYVSYLKQKAAGCVSKQGIETFKKV